jgi:hypothetical protein
LDIGKIRLMDTPDWIVGNKFIDICKYIYAPAILSKWDYAKRTNTLDIEKLEDGDIIFCTGFISYKQELLNIIKDTKKVILVSHNCDEGIDGSFEIPSNVIKWYGQNIKVVNPKIESIPTGLENERWFPKKEKKKKMLAQMQEKRSLINLVYMDHRIYCNPKERVRPYEILGKEPFVTAVTEENIVSFDIYLHYIYNHKFVISPEGNGVQTHRPWEVLYMGSIPIERRNVNNMFYEDLPICLVEDWDQVTEEFLLNWLIENQDRQWNMEKLKFSYWKEKICTS